MYPEVTSELPIVAEAGLTLLTFVFLGSGLPLSDGGHRQLELLQLHEVRPEGEGEGGQQAPHGDTEGTDLSSHGVWGLQLGSQQRSDTDRGLQFRSEQMFALDGLLHYHLLAVLRLPASGVPGPEDPVLSLGVHDDTGDTDHQTELNLLTAGGRLTVRPPHSSPALTPIGWAGQLASQWEAGAAHISHLTP